MPSDANESSRPKIDLHHEWSLKIAAERTAQHKAQMKEPTNWEQPVADYVLVKQVTGQRSAAFSPWTIGSLTTAKLAYQPLTPMRALRANI
jgi:hypothetical protein